MPYGSGAANKALNANRALLPKRKKNKRSYTTSKNETWIDPKQATFEQLAEIRTKIQKQRRVRTYKILVVMLVAIVVLFAILILTDWMLIFTAPGSN
ncbi:hypothetical protein [Dokdonia sp.]|uniref:hypothetical protein n=1 Tax=Dokdonia sp. TaxID=2024995 RepID=UPI003263B9FB